MTTTLTNKAPITVDVTTGTVIPGDWLPNTLAACQVCVRMN